jgi:hypothetical protein
LVWSELDSTLSPHLKLMLRHVEPAIVRRPKRILVPAGWFLIGPEQAAEVEIAAERRREEREAPRLVLIRKGQGGIGPNRASAQQASATTAATAGGSGKRRS